ncbi:hypothetical protein NP493_352g03040 [Ridgeia piscesae]|uniref:PIN domain-containing protein n=1 Tax=Ridgeia piscesae TaxID=27915 RepID=A0AAD9L453_RIDPI|nr:hypothetical protein NP493_352g03040 [Ridgeia piscesae]
MRDMAQLRLQTEVSQLEGSVQAADHPSLPPYLVPDACVLCDNLSLLKQLAASARFIIIIPLVVIDQLDILKKDSCGAREAIRWLEADFRKGNWYVRAQKNHEKTTALPLKNLKKKDRDAWRFLQIVDCCKYLAQQSGDCEPHGLACILSPYKVTSADISIRVKQAISSAQQDGIAVQTALEFHAKWKDLWKTSRG